MTKLGVWFLSIPFLASRLLRRFWAFVSDTAHFIQGLATRDQPRTQYLFTGRTPGEPLRMILTRPGHIEDELLRRGAWEPHVATALSFFARPQGTFVDVGANIGYHSLYVARSCVGVRVVCFEPHPHVRAELERNAALNDTGQVEIRPFAIGDRCGVAEFHAQSEWAYNRGASSIRKNSNVGTRYDRISVAVRTLDDELPDARVDLIKIDTEGCEAAVLRGAQKLIARCQPVVVFELDSRFIADPGAEVARIHELLSGYTFSTLGPDKPELRPFVDAAAAYRFYRADVIALPRRD